jgi:hypothetical protein
MGQDLWWIENNSWWPRDSQGWVFLARAVYELGRAKYPGEWTGEEPVTWANPSPATRGPLPEEPSKAIRHDIQYAHQVLKEQHPEVAARLLTFPTLIKPDDWKVAKVETERLRLTSLRIVWRFKAITQMIATEAEAGRLVTGLRPTDGGVVRAIPAVYWNTERLEPRFRMCQMNSADAFSAAFAGEGFGWIFVCAKDLERYIKSLKSSPVSSNQARKRAHQYLEPIMIKTKPAEMTRGGLIDQCARTQGVGVSAAREAYESLLPNADQSWRKMGRPRKSVK